MMIRRDRAMLAVSLVLDVAFHAGRDTPVSATDIAERLGSARRGLEPLLQALTRANVLESLRGPRGGYRLAGPARGIRLGDIVAVALASEADPTDGPGGKLQLSVLDPLWQELDRSATERLGALTVEDLLKRAATAGLRRPTSEPITYAI